MLLSSRGRRPDAYGSSQGGAEQDGDHCTHLEGTREPAGTPERRERWSQLAGFRRPLRTGYPPSATWKIFSSLLSGMLSLSPLLDVVSHRPPSGAGSTVRSRP